MKAVVLAAGIGSRLGALTDLIPKPMLPVAGRPLISHLLERLARASVDDVFVNLHHRPQALTEYCGDGSQWGLRIRYGVEPTLLGTAGAVRNFAEWLGDAAFLVVYGDNYFDCDFDDLATYHAACGALATIGLHEREDVSNSGAVEVDSDGRVRRFVEKPGSVDDFSQTVNAGIYVLSPAVFPLLPSTIPADFGRDVFPRLLAGGYAVYGRFLQGSVWPIDTTTLYGKLCARMSANG